MSTETRTKDAAQPLGTREPRGTGSEQTTVAKSVLREYFETIVVCVLILLFVRGFVFMQSKIPTESMLNTLLVGDYIFVDRSIYGAPGDAPQRWLGQREVRRGDVVVFRFPENPEVDFVKRVIGLPGDKLELRNGRVLINDQLLPEPYILPENIDPNSDFGPVQVPADNFFMMGDNRDNSRDSRAWGFLPRALVKGRAFFIWYSFDEQKNDHQNTGAKRIISMARKVRYFVSKTRWDRLFSQIH